VTSIAESISRHIAAPTTCVAAAGAGALAGGLVGALADWGIPPERVEQYETGIRDGGILMGVKARTDADARHLDQEWKACGAEHVHT